VYEARCVSYSMCYNSQDIHISIHNVIFSKYMLEHVLSVYEGIMNVAPGDALGGAATNAFSGH